MNKAVETRYRITNDFVFKQVFSEPEITKLFLEKLLGIKLKKIQIQSSEELRPAILSKWSVLDILAEDEKGNLYDMEMQNGHLLLVPRRYRGYGSSLDVTMMKRGMEWSDFRDRVIIFICSSDPFGRDLKQYTYQNICLETNEKLDDGTELICLNTQGSKGNVNVDIASFLHYAESGEDDGSALTSAIHQEVVRLNEDPAFVRQIMTLEEKIKLEKEDSYKNGRQSGLEEGIEKGIKQGIKQGERYGIDRGIRGTAAILRKTGMSEEEIIRLISEQYHLDKKMTIQILADTSSMSEADR